MIRSFLATDRRTRTTYIVETKRKGSRKLVSSAFRVDVREGDRLVSWRKVPIAIRRAAKAALIQS